MIANHIFIIGYMFAGKTTYGQQLACELGMPFIDLDAEIEKHCGKRITEIFADGGEEFFRQKEHEVLEEVCRREMPAVVACGGGTPCHHDNISLMKRHGKVVYLRTATETLIARAVKERQNRPLLAHIPDKELKDFMAKQVAEREFYYLQADLIHDSQPLNQQEK